MSFTNFMLITNLRVLAVFDFIFENNLLSLKLVSLDGKNENIPAFTWTFKSLNDPAPQMAPELQDQKDRDKLAAKAVSIIQQEIEGNQYIISCNGSWYSLHYYKNYWALWNASTSGRVPVFNALLEVKGGEYVATRKEITEVDKLNKIEWKGTVGYKIAVMRYYPLDEKDRKKGQPGWSEWINPSRSGSIIAMAKGVLESERSYPLFLYSVLRKDGKWEYRLIEGVQNRLNCEAVGKYSSTTIEGQTEMYVLFDTTETGILSPSAPQKVSGIDEWPAKLTVTNNLDLWLEIVPGVTKKGVVLKDVECLLSKWQEKKFKKAGLRLVAPKGEIGYNVVYSKAGVSFDAEARFGDFAASLTITKIFASLPIPGIGRLDDPVTFVEFWEKVHKIDSIEAAASALKSGKIADASKKLISLLGEEQQLALLRQAFAAFKIEVSKEAFADFLTVSKISKVLNILGDQITLAIQTKAGAKPASVSFYISGSRDSKSVAEESKKELKSLSKTHVVGPGRPIQEKAAQVAEENKKYPISVSNEVGSAQKNTAKLDIKKAEAAHVETPMDRLAKSMAEKLAASGIKTVAVVDFTDLQGNVTEPGRLLAEDFSAALVKTDKGFEVVDKSRLNGIIKAQKLTVATITDPATTMEFGKIAGIDAIITGTITPFGNTVRASAKLLLTKTGKVICVYRENIPKPKTIKEVIAKPKPKEEVD